MRSENRGTPQLRGREYAEGLVFVKLFLLELRSKPSGAEIILNGKLLENQLTPQILTLSKGSYEIEIKKEGYNSEHKTVEISRTGKQPIDVTLAPIVIEKSNYLRWVWVLAIAVLVIGFALWYRFRTGKIDPDIQYSIFWKRQIDEELAESGVASLKSIVRKQRYIDFTQQRYIEENPDYNLIYNRTENSLELKIIPEFNSQWKLAQENLENGNQEEFIQVIDKITEMLCETLGFDKLQDTPEQRGNIFAYLIDAPELRTKILSPFPFVYLREHTTSDDDFKSCLSSIVDAIKVNHSFAVLTVFDNASLLRLKVKKLLYPQYDFIVIDKNNFRGVLMAKDPQNVFVQTINMWWTTMFFEQSGCDVKVVDDKCIIEKTPGENLQE